MHDLFLSCLLFVLIIVGVNCLNALDPGCQGGGRCHYHHLHHMPWTLPAPSCSWRRIRHAPSNYRWRTFHGVSSYRWAMGCLTCRVRQRAIECSTRCRTPSWRSREACGRATLHVPLHPCDLFSMKTLYYLKRFKYYTRSLHKWDAHIRINIQWQRHLCWEKISLVVSFNRVDTSITRSRFSTCWRDGHKWSKATHI
jgi:hypothetical protein